MKRFLYVIVIQLLCVNMNAQFKKTILENNKWVLSENDRAYNLLDWQMLFSNGVLYESEKLKDVNGQYLLEESKNNAYYLSNTIERTFDSKKVLKSDEGHYIIVLNDSNELNTQVYEIVELTNEKLALFYIRNKAEKGKIVITSEIQEPTLFVAKKKK